MPFPSDSLRTWRPAARTTALLILALSFGLPGCDTGPYQPSIAQVVKGFIIVNGNPAWIVIDGETVSAGDLAPLNVVVADEPVVVRAGVPFDVSTSTFVAPGCNRVMPSVVTMSGRTTTITVYDAILDTECAFVLSTFERTDQIVFETPGPAEVVVSGVQFIRGQGHDIPAEFRFPVVVE